MRFAFMLIAAATAAHAQADPWTTTANTLVGIFTGALARAFVVVAIVVSGLTLAFSESGGKRGLAGLIFGGSLAIGASQMAAVLFH
jgi:type IV secretion system protein VirB2